MPANDRNRIPLGIPGVNAKSQASLQALADDVEDTRAVLGLDGSNGQAGRMGLDGLGKPGPAGAQGPAGEPGIQGPAGPAGRDGFARFRGEWDPTVQYQVGDMVRVLEYWDGRPDFSTVPAAYARYYVVIKTPNVGSEPTQDNGFLQNWTHLTPRNPLARNLFRTLTFDGEDSVPALVRNFSSVQSPYVAYWGTYEVTGVSGESSSPGKPGFYSRGNFFYDGASTTVTVVEGETVSFDVFLRYVMRGAEATASGLWMAARANGAQSNRYLNFRLDGCYVNTSSPAPPVSPLASPAPATVRPLGSAGTQVLVSWTQQTGATGYTVYKNGSVAGLTGSGESSYNVGGSLTNDDWSVAARYVAGTSAQAKCQVQGSTGKPVPPTPINGTMTSAANGSPWAKWDYDSETRQKIDGFRVYRENTDTDDGPVLVSTQPRSAGGYVDQSELSNDFYYVYYVSAYATTSTLEYAGESKLLRVGSFKKS